MSKPISFRKTYALSLTHSYYNAGDDVPIEITPTRDTARALEKTGGRFHMSHGRVRLFSDHVLDDKLTFDLIAVSPNVLAVTAKDGRPMPPDSALEIGVLGPEVSINCIKQLQPRPFATLQWIPARAEAAVVQLATFDVQHQFTIIDRSKEVDLSHARISGPDTGVTLPLARRERVLAAGQDALVLTPARSFSLKQRPIEEDQLSLHYHNTSGHALSVVLPSATISTLRTGTGLPTTEATIFL